MEVLALGLVLMIGLALLGLLWAIVSFVIWLLLLPFKLLGFLLHLFGLLLTLPFLAIGLLIGALVLGVGFLVPALPIVLLVLGVAWLVRRGRREAAAH